MQRLRLSTGILLGSVLTALVVSGLAVCTSWSWRRTPGHGVLTDPEEWPTAIHELIGDRPELRQDVRVYGISRFFDDQSVWLIEGSSPLLRDLFANNNLEPASPSHPMAGQLLSSIPAEWPMADLGACTWSATPEFGQRHSENVDLYLIVHDPKGGHAFVLHHWIF